MPSPKSAIPKADLAPTYVRLLNMMNAIRDMSPFSALTADEERLLTDLVVRWHEQAVITVSDVMASDVTPSASTTYRRLIALRDKGLIYLRVDGNDKRVKFVEPAPLANDYIKKISQSLGALIKSDRPI